MEPISGASYDASIRRGCEEWGEWKPLVRAEKKPRGEMGFPTSVPPALRWLPEQKELVSYETTAKIRVWHYMMYRQFGL